MYHRTVGFKISNFLTNLLWFLVQILNEMGELLANSLPLSFSREGIVWNPKETSKDVKEPWRALYG